MFPWSVMPIAGISNRCASAIIGATFAAPSSIEYSVWLCRWTKEPEDEPLIGWPVYCRPPTPSRRVAERVSDRRSAGPKIPAQQPAIEHRIELPGYRPIVARRVHTDPYADAAQ